MKKLISFDRQSATDSARNVEGWRVRLQNLYDSFKYLEIGDIGLQELYELCNQDEEEFVRNRMYELYKGSFSPVMTKAAVLPSLALPDGYKAFVAALMEFRKLLKWTHPSMGFYALIAGSVVTNEDKLAKYLDEQFAVYLTDPRQIEIYETLEKVNGLLAPLVKTYNADFFQHILKITPVPTSTTEAASGKIHLLFNPLPIKSLKL